MAKAFLILLMTLRRFPRWLRPCSRTIITQVTVFDPNDPNSFANKKFIEESGNFFLIRNSFPCSGINGWQVQQMFFEGPRCGGPYPETR